MSAKIKLLYQGKLSLYQGSSVAIIVNAIKNIKDQRVATVRRCDTYLPWIKSDLFYFLTLKKRMETTLTTIRESEFLQKKIAYWSSIAKRLRTTQDCNADYHSYKEIELRIKKWKERLKSLRRKV